MKHCLRISLPIPGKDQLSLTIIQQQAQQLMLEGAVHYDEQQVTIVACGFKENIETFLDFLHGKGKGKSFKSEPFLKEKDYRGVFRIIQ